MWLSLKYKFQFAESPIFKNDLKINLFYFDPENLN